MENSERNWGTEEWRAPSVAPEETILFSECGRIIGNIDYRSHYFRLVKSGYGSVSLLVKHGGGEERFTEYSLRKVVVGLESMDSEARYLMLHALFDMYGEGRKNGHEATENKFRAAFADGRLKKRKMPGRDAYKIWIEPKKLEIANGRD